MTSSRLSNADVTAINQAIKRLEKTKAGREALEVLERLPSLASGEKLAVEASFAELGGGPFTERIHDAGDRARAAIKPALWEDLGTVWTYYRRQADKVAASSAEAAASATFWAAAAALGGSALPAPARGHLTALLCDNLGDAPMEQQSTSMRTLAWAADHVDDLNAETYDLDDAGVEGPVLTVAQLGRVRRWLQALAQAQPTMWPGAQPALHWHGPMPALSATRSRSTWTASFSGVAHGQGPTLESAVLDLITKSRAALASTTRTEQTPESDLARWLHDAPEHDAVVRVTRMLSHGWVCDPKGISSEPEH